MSDTIHIQRTKAFKAILSRGDGIQIDEEELDAVVEGMNTGKVIIVKRGVINPSYLVSIERDKDRMEAFNRECNATFREPNGKTQGEIAYERGIKPLESIFGQTKVGKAIEAKQQERLGSGNNALPEKK